MKDETANGDEALERLARLLQNEPASEIETAVVHLLDLVVVPSETAPDEYECKLCGGLDFDHTETCPVPALEQWVTPTD
jgi:hypothetical protein